MAEIKEFTGYHGTSEENAAKIIKSKFIPSENHDDWLGYGVYFFIEGVSCPINNAKTWAINESWDKNKKNYKYTRYSIIETVVNVSEDKMLDLTTLSGLEQFNRLRNHIIKTQNDLFTIDRENGDDDQKICNMVIKWTGADVLISNLYIRDTIQRKKRIKSNIPNTTVMLVAKSSGGCISSTKQIETGETK